MYLFAMYFLLCILALGMAHKKSVLFETVIFVLFIGFFVLRFNQGPDTLSYVGAFFRVTHPIKDAFLYHTQRNIGFNILLYIGKHLLKNYRNFAVMMNLLMMGITGFVIYRYSENRLLSCAILLGSGVIEMYYSSGMRQMMAMSVFLFGYYVFYRRGMLWRYELTALVAFSFHECAIVALFVPLIIRGVEAIRGQDKRVLVCALIISILGFLMINYILPKYALRIYNRYNGSPQAHLMLYFAEGKKFSILGCGMEVVLLGLSYLTYRFADRKKCDAFDQKTLSLMIGVLWVYMLFSSFSVVSRVCDFLQVILVIYLPNMLSRMKFGKKRIFLGLCIVGLNAFLLYSDMRFKVNWMNRDFDWNYSVMNYPLDMVWNADAVNFYVHIVE